MWVEIERHAGVATFEYQPWGTGLPRGIKLRNVSPYYRNPSGWWAVDVLIE